jgi:hypothetical protein
MFLKSDLEPCLLPLQATASRLSVRSCFSSYSNAPLLSYFFVTTTGDPVESLSAEHLEIHTDFEIACFG